MYALRFTANDLLRCRFAVSPVLETQLAVRALHDTRTHAMQRSWLRRALPHRDRFAELIALQPMRGATPDFLSPTRADPPAPFSSLEEELAAVRAADPDFVRAELLVSAADQPDPGRRRIALRLAEDPASARDVLADQIELAWDLLIEEHWPRVLDLLDRDVAFHARVLAEGGLEALVEALDKAVSWRDDTLLVEFFGDERVDLGGRGLLLFPSTFIWPNHAISVNGPGAPAIMYPARGVAELWSRPAAPPGALDRLLGRARAALLTDLTEPASTTALARRHGLSPSTVSAHLTVLRDAGLVVARRDRRQMLYRRTSLGDLLL